MRYGRTGGKIELKEDADPRTIVSEADLESERAVLDYLIPRLRCGYVSEEAGEQRGESGYRVIVDSLDGSKNFVEGNLGLFGISAGIESPRGMEAGAICLPLQGDLLSAARGQGAFWNGVRIFRPKRGRLSRTIEQARLFIARGGAPPSALGRAPLRPLLSRAADILNTGSCVLNLASVARGGVDAMVLPAQRYWDIAAAVAIFRELRLPLGIWSKGWRNRLKEKDLTFAGHHSLFDVAAANNRTLFNQLAAVLERRR
jgi:myo-inositol-1(or 4)-monophosphatase